MHIVWIFEFYHFTLCGFVDYVAGQVGVLHSTNIEASWVHVVFASKSVVSVSLCLQRFRTECPRNSFKQWRLAILVKVVLLLFRLWLLQCIFPGDTSAGSCSGSIATSSPDFNIEVLVVEGALDCTASFIRLLRFISGDRSIDFWDRRFRIILIWENGEESLCAGSWCSTWSMVLV